MNLLEETKALAELAGLKEPDIRALGLTWRWYLKVRGGDIKNPGVLHVLALKKLAEGKLAGKRPKGRAA